MEAGGGGGGGGFAFSVLEHGTRDPPKKWHRERAVLGGGFFEAKTERFLGADTALGVT